MLKEQTHYLMPIGNYEGASWYYVNFIITQLSPPVIL